MKPKVRRNYRQQLWDSLGRLDVDASIGLLEKLGGDRKIKSAVANKLDSSVNKIRFFSRDQERYQALLKACVNHGIKPAHGTIRKILCSNISLDIKKNVLDILQMNNYSLAKKNPTQSMFYYIAEREDTVLLNACGDQLYQMGARASFEEGMTGPTYKAMEVYLKKGNKTFYDSYHKKLETYLPDQREFYGPLNDAAKLFRNNEEYAIHILSHYKKLEKRVVKADPDPKQNERSSILDLMSFYPGPELTKEQIGCLLIQSDFLGKHELDAKTHGAMVRKEQAAEQLQLIDLYKEGENTEGSTHHFRDYSGLISHSYDIIEQFAARILYPALIQVMTKRHVPITAKALGAHKKNLTRFSSALLFGRTGKAVPVSMAKMFQLVARMERAQDTILEDVVVDITTKWLPLTQDWTSSNGYRIVNLTTQAQLRREGKTLDHCVGGTGDRCAGGNLRVFSIRHAEAPDIPLYTAGLTIGMATRTTSQFSEPLGYKNESAPVAVDKAWNDFKNKLSQEELTVDWESLAKEKEDWEKRQDENAIMSLIGYDMNQGNAVESVYQGYRTALKAGNHSRLNAETWQDFMQENAVEGFMGVLLGYCGRQNGIQVAFGDNDKNITTVSSVPCFPAASSGRLLTPTL